jgi:signal recognition particle subunit SRP72
LTDNAELCKSCDDLSPEDKEAELLPITVQQLYVAVRLGKLGEAEKFAEECNVAE